MATTKLRIYNGALLKVGARQLASLTEDRDTRRWLDAIWDDGGVDYCLESGQWRFAMRTSKLSYDAAIDPAFGYSRAFQKPTDWILTSAVCSDEYFKQPLLQYTEEAGYLYADVEDIYVKYVSNDASYGMDYSLWTSTFTDYVKAYFARRIAPSVNQDEDKTADLQEEMKMLLREAKNRNQIAEPTKFPAQGAWNSSRRGRMTGRERGSSGSFTG